MAVFQILLLLLAANSAPVIAGKILGARFSWPLDQGLLLPDGFPLFGKTKTLRGVLSALTMSLIVAELLGLTFSIGALTGLMAMAGDLFSSFIKRRMGLAPSAAVFGLDQIPEALFPVITVSFLIELSIVEMAAIVAAFIFLEIVLSRLLDVIERRLRTG